MLKSIVSNPIGTKFKYTQHEREEMNFLVSNPIGTKFKCEDFTEETHQEARFKSHRDKVQIYLNFRRMKSWHTVSNPIGTKFKFGNKSLLLFIVQQFQIP